MFKQKGNAHLINFRNLFNSYLNCSNNYLNSLLRNFLLKLGKFDGNFCKIH